jgi:hypothetical protein
VQSGAVREICQRPPWRGATRGSRGRGGGRNWHSNIVSILGRSPAIDMTILFLLVATAVWLPGSHAAATAVDVCGNGRLVQDAGKNSPKSVSSDFTS